MHDFKFKNGELCCESVKVRSIAKKVGTPFYLYSHNTLVDHFTKIKKAFRSVNPLICFAMKANGNMAVIKTLIKQGAGIDIVSKGELQKALKVGANPKKIVFASVGKTEEEISYAIRKGILLFNIESVPELREVNRIAKKMGRRVRAALRINPDVEAPTHKAIVTGTLKNKFGLDLRSAHRVLMSQKDFSHVAVAGLHIHIGSQITAIDPYITAIKKVVAFIERVKKSGVTLEYLDIGGGMGIDYKGKVAKSADQFARALLPHLKETGLKIIIEPGRFIVGNAGIFVSQVVYLKNNGVKKFLIVDGGMNDLIRPTLYQAYHEIVPVIRSKAKKIKVDVVGPICESGDFFAKDRLLPTMKKGDLLAVMSTGAYGYVMASNYNVRPRVAEVIVKGKAFAVTKKRERFEDLIAGETIPGFVR